MNKGNISGMNRWAGLTVGLILVLIAGGTGYWLGKQGGAGQGAGGVAATADPGAAAGDGARKTPKLLYYRNPMGLPDTSPTPKKDPMGMDYIAVYEDDGAGADPAVSPKEIKISTEKVQKLGVRTVVAQMRVLDKTVRAAGRIEADEGRIYTISPKFEGYVDRLHVKLTGQTVAKGQALFEAYSPELVSAQREYAIAARGVDMLKEAGGQAQSGMKQLAEASLLRLANWDVSQAQVKALAQSGEARRTLTFRSPVSGVVTEKKALQGMRFMPGEALYQVVDLSSVWVIADVSEQDIGQVKLGERAKIRINAYPDRLFEGQVSYVYPTLNAATRTVPVRVELANPGLLLKPAMFVQMELPVSAKGAVLTVPVSALIDSGIRQIVLVQKGEGRFEPREVRVGARSDSAIEIIDGVRDGERVVVTANFLLDAESNLRAAIGGLGAADSPAAGRPAGHRASGRIDYYDPKSGTAGIEHGPIASLDWPAMTMEFKLANETLLKGLKPGARIDFEFVERGQGEWVITRVSPVAARNAGAPPAPAADAHVGH